MVCFCWRALFLDGADTPTRLTARRVAMLLLVNDILQCYTCQGTAYHIGTHTTSVKQDMGLTIACWVQVRSQNAPMLNL